MERPAFTGTAISACAVCMALKGKFAVSMATKPCPSPMPLGAVALTVA